MLFIALCLNLVVLTPVCLGLLRNTPAMGQVYGPKTPARGILLSVYLAIWVVSFAALLLAALGHSELTWEIAWPLFAVQITYKIITWPIVGLSNPVVVSNLVITLILAAALALGG